MMEAVYAIEPNLIAAEFEQVLVESTLAQRRPVDDLNRLDRMLRNADLIVTARVDGKLVGIARSITDFAFCCYLSDLAVSSGMKGQGIGRRLIEETRRHCGPEVSVILLAAPGAVTFYEQLDMPRYPAAFAYDRER